MPSRSGKQAVKKAEASRDSQESLAQLERAVFGDAPTNKPGHLIEPELWWSQHYHWLKDNGYLLRPRYAPDWIPSWERNNTNWVLCEDGHEAPVSIIHVRGSFASFIL